MNSDIKPYVYCGLDTETTGTSPQSEIIQIGLYVDDELRLGSDVGHRGNFHWEAKAFEINGFTLQRIFDGVPVYAVDYVLEIFVQDVCKKYDCEPWQIIPVGKNVGSFDIPLVRRTFSLFSSKLGYRSLDLNALLLAQYPNDEDYQTVKTFITEQAALNVKSKGQLHDALYDAELAIRFLQYWQGHESVLSMQQSRQVPVPPRSNENDAITYGMRLVSETYITDVE